MINYEWQIEQLERKLDNGFVFTAHWRCTATETVIEETDNKFPNEIVFSASSYGAEGFSQKSPDDPDFIPYEDLTEEAVKGWVMNKIGADIEQRLKVQIDAEKNPTSASGLPWTQNEEQS